jgi:tetratricopeptide (TPR) repeat protein
VEKVITVLPTCPGADIDRLFTAVNQHPSEVIAQGKQLLDRGRLDVQTQARLYNLLCHTSANLMRRSEVEAAFHGHEAVRFARRIYGREGRILQFDSLVNLGLASERIGEYDRAMDAFREALSMPLDWLGYREKEEEVLIHLGQTLYYRGDWEDAVVTFDQAATLAMGRGDHFVPNLLSSMRGLCYIKLEDLDEAEAYLDESTDAFGRETVPLRPKANMLANLALLNLFKGEEELTESYAQEALDLAVQVADPHAQVIGRLALAHCARSKRRVNQVRELSQAAARLVFDYGYVPLIQEFTWLMGLLYPHVSDSAT